MRQDVQAPGSRGGHFYIDKHGRVEYGDEPHARFHGPELRTQARPRSPEIPARPTHEPERELPPALPWLSAAGGRALTLDDFRSGNDDAYHAVGQAVTRLAKEHFTANSKLGIAWGHVKHAVAHVVEHLREKIDVKKTWHELKELGKEHGPVFLAYAIAIEAFEDIVLPAILTYIGKPALIPVALAFHTEPVLYPLYFGVVKLLKRRGMSREEFHKALLTAMVKASLGDEDFWREATRHAQLRRQQQDEARRVLRPGSRGAAYWIDYAGRVRYGRPSSIGHTLGSVGPHGFGDVRPVHPVLYPSSDAFLQEHAGWLPQDHYDAADLHDRQRTGPNTHPGRSLYHGHMAYAHRLAGQLKEPQAKAPSASSDPIFRAKYREWQQAVRSKIHASVVRAGMHAREELPHSSWRPSGIMGKAEQLGLFSISQNPKNRLGVDKRGRVHWRAPEQSAADSLYDEHGKLKPGRWGKWQHDSVGCDEKTCRTPSHWRRTRDPEENDAGEKPARERPGQEFSVGGARITTTLVDPTQPKPKDEPGVLHRFEAGGQKFKIEYGGGGTVKPKVEGDKPAVLSHKPGSYTNKPKNRYGVMVPHATTPGVQTLHDQEYNTPEEAHAAAKQLGGRAVHSRGAHAGAPLQEGPGAKGTGDTPKGLYDEWKRNKADLHTMKDYKREFEKRVRDVARQTETSDPVATLYLDNLATALNLEGFNHATGRARWPLQFKTKAPETKSTVSWWGRIVLKAEQLGLFGSIKQNPQNQLGTDKLGRPHWMSKIPTVVSASGVKPRPIELSSGKQQQFGHPGMTREEVNAEHPGFTAEDHLEAARNHRTAAKNATFEGEHPGRISHHVMMAEHHANLADEISEARAKEHSEREEREGAYRRVAQAEADIGGEQWMAERRAAKEAEAEGKRLQFIAPRRPQQDPPHEGGWRIRVDAAGNARPVSSKHWLPQPGDAGRGGIGEIGRTRSGKPVPGLAYRDFNYKRKEFPDWTEEDHRDAQNIHRAHGKLLDKLGERSLASLHHGAAGSHAYREQKLRDKAMEEYRRKRAEKATRERVAPELRTDIAGERISREHATRAATILDDAEHVKKVPPAVREHIRDHVNALNRAHEELMRGRNMGERYAADVWINNKYGERIPEHVAALDEFKRHAPKNGVDADAVLRYYGHRGNPPRLTDREREWLPAQQDLVLPPETESEMNRVHSIFSKEFGRSDFPPISIENLRHSIASFERRGVPADHYKLKELRGLADRAQREHDRKAPAYTHQFNPDLPGNPTDYWRGMTQEEAHRMIRQHTHPDDADATIGDVEAGHEITLKHGVRVRRVP